MAKFIVEGGKNLEGDFHPAGNKNEALPILAACLMADGITTISNLPRIGDINSFLQIIQELGVTLSQKDNNTFSINASSIINKKLSQELCHEIRGSFLLIVPLLYRFGYVEIPIPGGDAIGRRRLDSHIMALEKMGVEIKFHHNTFSMKRTKFVSTDIVLDETSVTATENTILAATISEGTTTIYNAACEPHVQGLCRFLNLMGADIQGIGSNYLTINGVKNLSGCQYFIQPDHIEIGSIIGLSAVTQSNIRIKNVSQVSMGIIPQNFERLGVYLKYENNDIYVSSKQNMTIKKDIGNIIPKIDDAPWPGFPADLISIIIVTATQCNGNILIYEKLFESRLFWIDKLVSMGAGIVLCDPHRVLINGKSSLRGAILNSPDIRAGMALLIASLCAEGTSEIHNIQQIDRGYENIDKKLNDLGACIKRI